MDVRGYLLSLDPTLVVSGEPMDPPEPRKTLAGLAQTAYMVALMLLFFGDSVFGMIGWQRPEWYTAAQQNKVGQQRVFF